MHPWSARQTIRQFVLGSNAETPPPQVRPLRGKLIRIPGKEKRLNFLCMLQTAWDALLVECSVNSSRLHLWLHQTFLYVFVHTLFFEFLKIFLFLMTTLKRKKKVTYSIRTRFARNQAEFVTHLGGRGFRIFGSRILSTWARPRQFDDLTTVALPCSEVVVYRT